MDANPVSIKWIIIGAAIMGGLSWLLPLFLFEPVLPGLVESFGLQGGWIVFGLIVAFGAFFCGSAVVAYFSPGTTIREPAAASTLAIAFNQIYFLSQDGAEFSPVGIAISVLMGYAFAFAGAKVGERLQGDTTDKLRERGQLRG
jgi:hypothetical protein